MWKLSANMAAPLKTFARPLTKWQLNCRNVAKSSYESSFYSSYIILLTTWFLSVSSSWFSLKKASSEISISNSLLARLLARRVHYYIKDGNLITIFVPFITLKSIWNQSSSRCLLENGHFINYYTDRKMIPHRQEESSVERKGGKNQEKYSLSL